MDIQKSLLETLDSDHLIHPVTNLLHHENRGPTILKEASGVWLTDDRGNKLLDAFSGLWCVNIGYGQQTVVQAALQQMQQLPYATGYFHFSSEPAIKLAARLVELTPSSLQRVYFTLGGSDAVDAAVRYITHYFNSIGQPQKKHFISQVRGYHGSSAVGSGLTGLPAFHKNFDVPHANQHHIPCVYPYRDPDGNDPQTLIQKSVQALRNKVAELGADRVAAFFCEPIIGSGGVIVPPQGWLKAIETTCKELGILLVVDEVITGFGRTGPMFACENEGVEPDLMTMAKGLTSGYAPMGAVMMSDQVYRGIADGNASAFPVGHGQTYSAHPVSAAVALEVLNIYTEGGMLKQAQEVTPYFHGKLEAMCEHPLVGEARYRGMLGALELVADKHSKQRFDPSLKMSEKLSRLSLENGIIFRAFADDILGFAPALCFTKEDFDILFDRLWITLDQLLEAPDVIKAVA